MSPRQIRWVVWFLRITLSAVFLSAVADRFGLWGPPGSPQIAWGDFQHFLKYTAQVNSFAPRAFIPFLGWTATIAELVLGIWLLAGFKLHWAAYASAVLLLAFAVAMTISFGIKSPLNYSVFPDAAAALALGALAQLKKEQPCHND